jgi:quinol monooxygenase YgiN
VIALEGLLICHDRAEATLVAELLPAHIALTLAEPGCLSFAVQPTDDPLVWSVSERFSTAESFQAHQARVRASEWGLATVSIERRYSVTGLDA